MKQKVGVGDGTQRSRMWPSCGVPAWPVCCPGTGKSCHENNDFLPTATTTHSLLHQALAVS